MHNTLRAFYQWTIAKGPVATANEGNQLLKEQIHALYDQYWIPVGFESKEQRERMYAQGKEWLDEYLERGYNPLETVVDLERPFSIKLTPELRLGGRIDRVSRLPDGKLEIVDYKTGSPKTKKDLDRDLQLAIYAIAATDPAVYNEKIENLSLAFYYFENAEKVCVDISPVQLDLAKKEILSVKEQMEQSDFACSSHIICKGGCEYDLFCNRGE